MTNQIPMTNDQMTKIDQNRSIFENSPENSLFMRALSPLFGGSDPFKYDWSLVIRNWSFLIMGFRLYFTLYGFIWQVHTNVRCS